LTRARWMVFSRVYWYNLHMDSSQFYIILGVITAGFAALFYYLNETVQAPADNEALKVMMEWMKDIKQGTEMSKQSTEQNIKDLNKAINERLDNAGRVISALTKELGGVSQIGPDIRRLTETLTSPKLRGNFGEEILENLLTDIFPKELCKFQHRFKNGEVVDAALVVGDILIPIDSKFSMENYRLFKEAKTDEAADNLKKTYILPQEGTLDYAFMFIPSEGVYMEVAENQDVQIYARGKKVVIVGPNTLNINLRAILVSLRGQQIGKAAQQVLAAINGIKQEADKFGRTLDTMANHVKNTNNSMSVIVDGYVKLKSQITNAANLQLDAPPEVEKIPEVETKKLL
jgi:DNA recombination protein RmuC